MAVTTVTFAADPVAAQTGEALYQANAGGSFTADGETWDPLVDYIVAGGENTASFGQPSTIDGSVPAGTPSQIWETERWDPSGGEEMQMEFSVPAGQQVEVRLYFYDGYSGTSEPGDRVFDVSIEDETVLDNFDIIAEYGDDTGAMESFVVTSDGTVDVDFGHVTENPQVVAVEILATEAEPDTLGGPSAVDFGTVVTGNAATETVTLENLGNASNASHPDIEITDVSITGTDAGDFSHDFAGSVVLAPEDSTSVDVTFAPSDATAKSANLEVTHNGSNSPLTVDLTGEGASDVPVGFQSGDLQGFSASAVTAVDFGPDGRLYASTQGGTVYALNVTRNGPADYSVDYQKQIDAITQIPNHDDNGNYESGETNRQITGLTVGGTASTPVLYVTSSDPTIDVGTDDDDTDTNSGALSRLTLDWGGDGQLADSEIDHDVLVLGLPRSEENHATNGIDLSPDGDTLYVAQGGHTNKGAPGDNFGHTPEYALSGATLAIDLAQIDANFAEKNLQNYDPQGSTESYPDLTFLYAIPTVQTDDATDGDDLPFGGDDGLNQAKLVAGGPVQIWSPGYRNPYDLTVTEAGLVYVTDNGPNGGWGGEPADSDGNTVEDAANVTNHPNEDDGYTTSDQVHLATDGHYAGHAAPIRANPDDAGLYFENGTLRHDFDSSDSPVPFTMADPRQANYVPPESEAQGPDTDDGPDGSLDAGFSPLGGIVEYRASNFGGEMEGDLLAVEFFGATSRLELNATGEAIANRQDNFLTADSQMLGITAQDDDAVFPGTVWTSWSGIAVFEPNDYGDGDVEECTGADDTSLDEDGDGYDNADEIDAGTDPCSAASTPSDFDSDGTSDLNDTDDDNDGATDEVDPFAIDPANGTTTSLPVDRQFQPDSVPNTVLDLGFTGLMTNGVDDYQDLYDPGQLTAGGAANVLTVENVPPGDAFSSTNTQQYAFQYGVDAPDQPFVVHTTVSGYPDAPEDFQSMGLFVGNGDQDDYLKLVVSANGGAGGIQYASEVDGAFSTVAQPTDGAVTGPANSTDLSLVVFPNNSTVQAYYTPQGGAQQFVGETTVPASWLDSSDGAGLAVGVISTSNGASAGFDATWHHLSTEYLNPPSEELTVAEAVADENAPEDEIGLQEIQLAINWWATESTVPDTGGETISLTEIQQLINMWATGATVGDSGATALVEITPDSGVEATTYGTGSYQVTNTGEQNITSVAFDLSTAHFPDMVFDPEGTAGDPTGQGFTVADEGGTGITTAEGGSEAFSQPHNGVNGSDGYDVMTVEFNDFQPGEMATFWADNDPTSIKGATVGSQEAGPVSGLELARSTVTLTYEDGTTQTTQLMGDGSAGGSTANVTGDEAPAPSIGASGVSLGSSVLDGYHSAATVDDASQTVVVTGEPGATVTLVRAEGELTLTNVEQPYNDLEAYEANDAEAVQYYTATLDATGQAAIPVTLTNTTSDGDNNAGFNYFVAVHGAPNDEAGLASNVVVLELVESVSAGDNAAPSVEAITDQGVSQNGSTAVAVNATDADGDALTLSLSSAPTFVSLTDNGDGTGTLDVSPGTAAVGTYTVTVSADDGNASASESFAVYVDEENADGTVVYAVNANGGSYTAADGTTYQADTDFIGGNTYSDAVAIDGTTDDTLYQTERYGDFSYEIPIANGTYEVTLQFAEIFQGVSDTDSPDSSGPSDGTNENDRLFDVAIEGSTVVTSYDIFSEVGPATASDKQYTADVSDGTLNVDFSTVNDNAKISAIRVEQLPAEDGNTAPTIDAIADQTVTEGETAQVAVSASDADGDALTLSLSSAPSFVSLTDAGDGTGTIDIAPSAGDNGTYTVSVTADDGNDTATESFELTVVSPTSDTVVMAVNAGGSNYTAVDGTAYVADTAYGGTFSGSSGTSSTDVAIGNTQDDPLYQTERYGDPLSYTAPVAAGTYNVTLQFAEIWHTSETGGSGDDSGGGDGELNDRVFNVSVEGQQVLTNYDIYAEVGGLNATEETFTVEVTDGSLDIELDASADFAKLSAFRVANASGVDGNQPPAVDAISDQTVTEGETAQVAVSASDPDGDALSLSLTSAPTFVSLTDDGDGTGTIDIAPQAGDNGTYTVEVTADDGSATDAESFQLTVEANASGAQVFHRVNAGGSTLAAIDDGPDWTGVTGTGSQYLVSVSGSNGNYCGGDDVTPTSTVPSTTPDAVFDCERYGNMTWAFDVASGTDVEVRLYLSNQFPGTNETGDRQFNVSIEGTQVLTQYDPVADVGHANGTMKSFVVTSDGTIDVVFEKGAVENPQVNAIEIVEQDGGS